MMPRLFWRRCWFALIAFAANELLLLIAPLVSLAAESKVSIRADFAGGNVLVEKEEGDSIYLAPDLRGGAPWFYWHFEATALSPGTVNFVFANPPMIGVRGPAVSLDDGKSWRWLGSERVRYARTAAKDSDNEQAKVRHDRFSYNFATANQKVRFAVAIPYTQRDLDNFLASQGNNPFLQRSVLTHSRAGRRPVELLQVGSSGPNVQALLVTARHHACESMASYVLEGFLREAISDSLSGIEFRKRYVLFAVPFVDKDGVEAGDQGKNRPPHDHNRDYGDSPIYTEIQAIQELADRQAIRFSLDLHCPFLLGDIHEAFHFVGLGLPHIKDNLREWSGWIREERPQIAMVPLDFLTDPSKPNAVNRKMNSHYFATRKDSVFSVCLEIPFTQSNVPLDATMAREYGASLLKAWTKTQFLEAEPNRVRDTNEYAQLASFRTNFTKLYRSRPLDAEALAKQVLDAGESALSFRAEANYQLAQLKLFQRRFAEANQFAAAVIDDVAATASQRMLAESLRIQVIATNPESTLEMVETAFASWNKHPYSSLEQQAKVIEQIGNFYFQRKDLEKAIEFARQQRLVVPVYEQGKLLNRIAILHDLQQRPAEAIASRKEAVEILRQRLGNKPERSIFGANMTIDLFDALAGIPTATLEEKQAAATMVLNHDIVSETQKQRIRQAMKNLETSP